MTEPRQTHTTWKRFFWPQRLRYQLALIFAAVISVAIVTFTFHVTEEETRIITTQLQKHTAALAENIATAAAQYLLVRDYTSIEGVLIGAANFPGITRIEISDSNGRIVGAVAKDAYEQIETRYGLAPLELPPGSDRIIALGEEEMVIWQPVLISGLIGWTRISYDLHPIEESRKQIWYKNLRDGGFIALATFFAIALFLRRPTQTFSRYTDFAEQLNQRLGEEVRLDNGSIEFARLGAALNRASTAPQAGSNGKTARSTRSSPISGVSP